MGSCRLGKVAGPNIADVFVEPLLELSSRLSNVLHPLAGSLVALDTEISTSTFNLVCSGNEWAGIAFGPVASFHSGRLSGGSPLFRQLGFYKKAFQG